MRVVLFGDRGWVGGIVARAIPGVIHPAQDIRIDSGKDVRLVLASSRPDVVVNCAGRVGKPNVDWCEDHPFETWHDNAIGPVVLAEECARRKIHLIHVGSGCVFAGRSPHVVGIGPGYRGAMDDRSITHIRRDRYGDAIPASSEFVAFRDDGWREDDTPNATSLYARSKAAADLLLGRLPDVAVVRIRMPISRDPHPRSLPDKLAGYKVVCDVVNSVTFVDELPAVILKIAEARATGVFHAVAPGALSHRDVISAWRHWIDKSMPEPEWVADSDALCERGLASTPRSHAILADMRLRQMGAQMDQCHCALERILRERSRR